MKVTTTSFVMVFLGSMIPLPFYWWFDRLKSTDLVWSGLTLIALAWRVGKTHTFAVRLPKLFIGEVLAAVCLALVFFILMFL